MINDGAYIGYKTTEDPNDAITDLTLLDMKNTHYEEIDYQKFLDDHLEDFRNEAAQMIVLVNELDRKVTAGSPNALMAYDSLNLIYVDENKPHDAQTNQLGYYLINHADITFFEKFIQRGNSQVLAKITSLLSSASADYSEDGTTWVDRAKVSEIATQYANATSATKNEYDQKYEDSAKKLVEYIRSFSETYTEAKRRLDQYGETLGYSELIGMTAENSSEKLAAAGTSCRFPEYSEALKTYALLDAYSYQKKGEPVINKADLLNEEETENNESSEGNISKEENYTKDVSLAEYIMELAKDETLEDHLSAVYPLVQGMTQAQRAALLLSGFGKLIDGLYQSNDYPAKRSQAIEESMQKLKEYGCSDGRVYLWSGIDKSIYNKKVVQTDARKEAAATGIDLQNSLEETARKENDTLTQVLSIVDICTMGYGGLMMIVNALMGTTLWTIGLNVLTCAGVNIAAGAVGTAVAGYVIGALFCALQVLNIVCMVVGLVMLVYNILRWTGIFETITFTDYSNIPDVVFDARQSSNGTYSVRYNSVRSNAEERYNKALAEYKEDQKKPPVEQIYESPPFKAQGLSSDHAEMHGYHLFSNKWMAMYYTKAPAAGQPIEVKRGQEFFVTRSDYHTPEGYRPLTLIISSTAANINDVSVLESDKKGKPLYAFFPGKASGIGAGCEVADSGTYITEVRLSSSQNQQDAINLLKKSNYEYFDVNLTPYSGYTYLCYKKGSEANALRDIRISNAGISSIAFGEATYAKMGQDGNETTPDGLALYGTKSVCAGSPIVSISIENKRLELGSGREPICLFSGGNAVDIGANWRENILEMIGGSVQLSFMDSLQRIMLDKLYVYELISEDDPANGIYLYFQPKEQFKSTDKDGNPAQRYISGFSYFLAGDKETKDNRFGSNYEFMQTFAKENGFELVKDTNGEAFRVMSEEAGEMSMGFMWRDVNAALSTGNFDMIHTIQDNKIVADFDGEMDHEVGFTVGKITWKVLSRHSQNYIYHTAMYFGMAYTYNPYRAITGVSGLITPYTEKNDQIKFTGMKTPAGTFQTCNVSMQGFPINSAGITAGYYHPNAMRIPLYTNYEAKQHSDLSWTTDQDMEVLSHYLMTSGPRSGILPLKEGDIAFSMQENPGQMSGFVPLCDLRTPGDYDHPMNLALDTTNKGSRYLYLYLKADAGGREENDVALPQTNVYTKKKNVAAVFCGVGKTPEAAIANLYANAANIWSTVASTCKDISARPMVTEFDEIIPIDLSSEHPWYTLHLNDVNVSMLPHGQLVRGNELAYYRWDGYTSETSKTPDEYEKDWNCAYIGVVRTSNTVGAAYGILKYYSTAKTAPANLTAGSTKCTLAGGPVKSKEGSYFLYYSTNSGTAGYQSPITSINISDEIFVNGYNTAFSVSDSERVNNMLPQYSQLRMRTDEFKYIHMSFSRSELPYYEQIYLGVGDTKEAAYADLVGTTNAYAVIDVNCNYNSYSKKWIAVGYRRTSVKKNAITDIFLYSGDNPPEEIRISGGYTFETEKDPVTKKKVQVFKNYADKKGTGVPYKLLKHNLKSGSEVVSLNEGNGGIGLYLYYTTAEFYMDKSAESLIAPITNICCAYGDISPRYASTEQLADVFEKSFYRSKNFDMSVYQNPLWECVMGVEGSPSNWNLTADGATRFSLNEGVIPGFGSNDWAGADKRVYMYVDRANFKSKTTYQIRENAKFPETGYYSPTSTFGYLMQTG